jgi:hypothetical protein
MKTLTTENARSGLIIKDKCSHMLTDPAWGTFKLGQERGEWTTEVVNERLRGKVMFKEDVYISDNEFKFYEIIG